MKQLSTNNILVIEDNRADTQLIKEYLKEASFKYKMFHSPSLTGGIGLIEEESIDLVLLDLSLDDTSGFGTLTNYLKKAEDIPVIVLTRNKNETVGIRSVSAGAQDFLVKGEFSQQRLINAIKYSIQRFKSKAKLRKINHILTIKEKRYKAAQKIGRFTNWEMNIVNNEMKWSRTMFNILGFDQPSFSPSLSEYLRYVHIEDKPEVETFFNTAIKTGELTKVEHRVLVNGRQVKHIALRAQVKYDEITNKIILLGNLQEITESKNKQTSFKPPLEKNKTETKLPFENTIPIKYDYFDRIGKVAKSFSALAATGLDKNQSEILNDIIISLSVCAKSTGSLYNFAPLLGVQKTLEEGEFNLFEISDNVKALFEFPNILKFKLNILENVDKNETILGFKQEIQNIIINLLYQVADSAPDNSKATVKISNKHEASSQQIKLDLSFSGDLYEFSTIALLAQEQINTNLEQLQVLLQKYTLDTISMAFLLKRLNASIEVKEGGETGMHKVQVCFPVKNIQKKVKEGSIASPVKVLLVEDHAINQIVMRKTLTAWSSKIKVDIVKTELLALEALKRSTYDLIIINVKILKINDIPTFKKGMLTPPSIIGTSSVPSSEEKKLCLESGMDVYLEKPFTNESLFNTIIHLLEQS